MRRWSNASGAAEVNITPTRILVLGNSGSGKSTHADALAARHGLARLDLDTIAWEPGQIAVRRGWDAVLRDLLAFIERETQWVIEGCYGDIVEAALPYCTQLVFLNPGLEACLANNELRPWEPHKYPSKAEQDAGLPFLRTWVADYYTRNDDSSYAHHRRVFDAFTGDKLERTTVGEPPA
jgi:adenylate kinase family enzyme